MCNSIKVLVIGDFTSQLHELAVSNALEAQGINVSRFKIGEYFTAISEDSVLSKFFNLWTKFQNKFKWGREINKLNKDFVCQVNSVQPDLIFLYRPVVILPYSLEIIDKSIKIFIYNNDDPFGFNYPKYVWRHYFGLLKYAHCIFYYRAKNKSDFSELGYNNTELLRSYYIAKDNYRISDLSKSTNLLFIGHYEDDGRDRLMLQLFKANIGFELFGPEWHRSPIYDQLLSYQKEIIPLRGADYNKKINESLICLVLLSKLNSDTYTRRCFEIPATGTMMLCTYTDDMASMFLPDEEAVYFLNENELIEKAKFYIDNPEKAIKVGNSSFDKALKMGCEVSDRAKQILDNYRHLSEIAS